MIESREPQATLTVHLRANSSKDVSVLHEVYEGEVKNMTQEQQDSLKQLLGDGQARVTVSREISAQDYGRGGKVFVSVSLACDQSTVGVTMATRWAGSMVDAFVLEQHGELQQRLVGLGIIARSNT